MTESKSKKSDDAAPKVSVYRDSRTGALRRTKGTLGYPYVGPLSAADVKSAEAPKGAQDQAGGAQAPEDTEGT